MCKRKKKTEEEIQLEKKRIIVHEALIKYQKKRANEPKEAPKDAYISLKNVNKIYDNHVQAVHNFDLDIKKNEFIVFVGPSGCGKSTTLRMIAGLEEITSGDLYIDGVYSNSLEPRERDIAMVFQSYALYPHMSVYDNIAFGLKMRHMEKTVIDQKVHEVAKLLNIEEYLDRKPKALSGGQRQRVALGRAIARNAKAFLMDEPLSNLDAKLRVQMRSELVALHQKINATTIYVTHDQTEAMTMATRIVVMKDGFIQQIGTPGEIFNKPANMFVATFVGSPAMNMLEATYNKGEITIGNLKLDLGKSFVKEHEVFYKNAIENNNTKLENNRKMIEEYNSDEQNKKSLYNPTNDVDIENLNKENEWCNKCLVDNKHDVVVGIRPEYFITESQAKVIKNKSSLFDANIRLVEMLGSEYIIHAEAFNNEIVLRVPADRIYQSGEILKLCINLDKINIFDSYTKQLIH